MHAAEDRGLSAESRGLSILEHDDAVDDPTRHRICRVQSALIRNPSALIRGARKLS